MCLFWILLWCRVKSEKYLCNTFPELFNNIITQLGNMWYFLLCVLLLMRDCKKYTWLFSPKIIIYSCLKCIIVILYRNNRHNEFLNLKTYICNHVSQREKIALVVYSTVKIKNSSNKIISRIAPVVLLHETELGDEEVSNLLSQQPAKILSSFVSSSGIMIDVANINHFDWFYWACTLDDKMIFWQIFTSNPIWGWEDTKTCSCCTCAHTQ